MTSPALFVVSTLKALVEIAGMSLVAQGLIGMFSGENRRNNPVYRLLQVITAPVIRLIRMVTPRFVKDARIGLTSLFVLFWLWVILVFAKVYVCHAQNLACVGC